MLTTTIGTSTSLMGKGKVQEKMANFVPPLMGLGSSVVVTIGLLQKLVTTIATCICEFF